MQLTYFGHACFLATIGESRVLFDPFIRHNPLAQTVDVEAIEADFILLSHGHYDHIAEAEEIARRTGATIVGIAEVADYFKAKGLKTIGANVGGVVKLPFGNVKLTTAVHSSSFPDGSYAGIPVGFVIQPPAGPTFYFAGDTALTYDLKLIKERFQLDFALLPLGDHYTMGVADALTAAAWVGATKVVGMHFDTFPPLVIDHEAAQAAAQHAGIDLHLLTVGQHIEI